MKPNHRANVYEALSILAEMRRSAVALMTPEVADMFPAFDRATLPTPPCSELDQAANEVWARECTRLMREWHTAFAEGVRQLAVVAQGLNEGQKVG